MRGERGEIPVQSFHVEADEARGVIRVNLGFAPDAAPADNAVLARITLRGSKSGISYLVYRTPAIRNTAGEPVHAQVRAARVVIK